MALLGAAALLFFGPEQLPRVARKAGNVMREIQNTSQSFIRELERAADVQDAPKPYEPPEYDPAPYEVTPHDPAPYDAATEQAGTNGSTSYGAEPYAVRPYFDQPYEVKPDESAPAAERSYGEAPSVATRAIEPPAPAPERPANVRRASTSASVGEKLAEPRPALDLVVPADPGAGALDAVASDAAEPAPKGDPQAHL